MKALLINLKRLFLSVWTIILFLFCMVMDIYYFVRPSGGNVGVFVNNSGVNFNIFLQVFVSIVSVYVVHSTKEAEYGLLSRQKLLIIKYLSVIIYSLSSMIIPFILVVIGGIISSVSPLVLVNLFSCYLVHTVVQVIFTAALSIAIACLIKNKAAYIVSLAAGQVFSVFIQQYIARHGYILVDNRGYSIYEHHLYLLNLFNIVYDETSRIRYSGYGAPFNSETILSWIITVLAGLVIFALVLLLKRCYKLKGNIITAVVVISAAIPIAPLTILYFNNCPVSAVYNAEAELDPRVESGELPPELGDPPTYVMPSKVDFLNVYDSENSPLVRSYKMELRTGNTVKNDCIIGIDPNGNDSVEFKLDECFKIEELLVNGTKANYDRNGSQLTIKDITNDGESTISVKYSGRMNYIDGADNKTDFCDLTGGCFSSFFAWYPKILSNSNTELEKDFEITIDACNSFVTNLDDSLLHTSGRHTITGSQKDMFVYMGYISSLELENKNIILPTEFKNNKNSLAHLRETLNQVENGEAKIYDRDGVFAVFDWDVTGLTQEEIFELLEIWSIEQYADSDQIRNVDTVIILPITYNSVYMTYVDDNIIFMCERRITTRCF